MPSLRSPLLLAALWLVTAAALTAGKPRVATVDASELFSNYYRTKEEHGKLAVEREKMKEDPRFAVITASEKELQKLQAKVRDTANSEEAREEYFRKYQMKSHEYRSLRRDTTQHLEDQQTRINERLVKISKALLREVQSAAQRVAIKEGYDMVFDIGGDTSSQVPTLLFIRESTDITGLVLKELNRTKPEDLPPGVHPAPATPPIPSGATPSSPPAAPVVPAPAPSAPTPVPTPVAPIPVPPVPAPVPPPIPPAAPAPAPVGE